MNITLCSCDVSMKFQRYIAQSYKRRIAMIIQRDIGAPLRYLAEISFLRLISTAIYMYHTVRNGFLRSISVQRHIAITIYHRVRDALSQYFQWISPQYNKYLVNRLLLNQLYATKNCLIKDLAGFKWKWCIQVLQIGNHAWICW